MGYLAGLRIAAYSYDLADLANRVKVGYKFVIDQGSGVVVNQFYTSAANDLGSQADFGIKEKVISSTTSSATLAAAQRDQALASISRPKAKHTPTRDLRATLTFRGWYGTLDWLSYANSAGIEGYAVDGSGTQNIGDVASTTWVMQGFTGAVTGWVCDTVWLQVLQDRSTGRRLECGDL